MSRFPLVALPLAAMAFFGVIPVVQADLVLDDEVTKFNGTITDVGVVRGPLQTGGVEYRIRGEFKSSVDINLRNSTFTIEEFFVEEDRPGVGDGAGELMRESQGPGDSSTDPPLAPKSLGAAVQGDADDAKWETPGRYRPQIRVKAEKDEDSGGGFKFKFDVRLDRGMMRDRPNLCPGNPGTPPNLTPDADGKFRTPIRIGFTIAEQGSSGNKITVSTTKPWECPQPGRYHLRSR